MTPGSLWSTVQSRVAPDTTIPNWTAAKGLLGDSFMVVGVGLKHIDVVTPCGENIQHIPMTDFEAVGELWQKYICREIGRNELRDQTHFSKYIISILHWIEKGVDK